jgi:inorganic pyrophosphatase
VGGCAACRRFFEDYKKNENKHVRVDEILGAEEAIKAVKDGLVRGRGAFWQQLNTEAVLA